MPTGTTPPVAESTMVPRASDLSTLGILTVTCNVSNENKLDRKVGYLFETAIKKTLEEEQELEDTEAQEIQEVAEQAKATRLLAEKEKHVLETEMRVTRWMNSCICLSKDNVLTISKH